MFPAWERLAVAGRTDAGVHARGQVASFTAESGPPPDRAAEALNAQLPDDVAVTVSSGAPDDFHARFSARARTYRYRIWTRRTPSPLERRRALWWPRPLDETRLSKRFAMSRTPVREAMVRLAAEGLVTTLPNRNTIVTPIDFSSVPVYFDALVLMYRVTSRLAAMHRKESDLIAIRALGDAFARTVEDADAFGMIAVNRERFVKPIRALPRTSTAACARGPACTLSYTLPMIRPNARCAAESAAVESGRVPPWACATVAANASRAGARLRRTREPVARITIATSIDFMMRSEACHPFVA